MKTERITDKNGINFWIEKPKEGQMCQTKQIGGDGFHGKSKYTNGYFETYEDKHNRTEITRWKVDLWLSI